MSSLNICLLCESCVTGGNRCELILETDRHLREVAQILSKPGHPMIIIENVVEKEEPEVLRIHTTLLCYYSCLFRHSIGRETNISVTITSEHPYWMWKYAVQWCYTGRFEEQIDKYSSDRARLEDTRLEEMWNFATDFEMFELANYCMRLIFQKYSRGYMADVDWWSEPSDGEECPYEVEGPWYVFDNNQDDVRRTRLFKFMEDLTEARKLKSKEPNQVAGYIELDASGSDDEANPQHDLEDQKPQATLHTLPTCHTQWQHYFIPVDSRSADQWTESYEFDPNDRAEAWYLCKPFIPEAGELGVELVKLPKDKWFEKWCK
ncbi:hypothetical protein F5B20DRAFT_582483 [Whalleya microplaca]|nr:hypothetical protein F5B20DRAFT_582483 [Whalleya microplaca]